MIPPPPPKLSNLKAGTKLVAGLGISTVLPSIDFETYSPAGFVWNEERGTFETLPGATKKGLSAIGAAIYSQHPETEVLSCAYDLKDGIGARIWIPGEGLT